MAGAEAIFTPAGSPQASHPPPLSGASGPPFIHRFEHGREPQDQRTLLLLHGMGGDETDLLQMGRLLAPGAALLSPRGKVVENGLRRFFRRLAKGVFDPEDVRRRAGELADFVEAAAAWYGFHSKQVLAVGYSNGANMAAALLLLHPDLLSPRGKVVENGLRRFFRRLAKGVFDPEDVRRRAGELADFVPAAAAWYGFDLKQVLAVGYSNGANMAAALLLLHPELLTGAVLFRPMVPLAVEALPDLSGKKVFISGGRSDRVVPPEHSERLSRLLAACRAQVTLGWVEDGHALREDEIERARQWLLPVQGTPLRAPLGEEFRALA